MKNLHLKDCTYSRKGVKYPYYAIATSEKIDGKSQKKILTYVGKLTEREVENYRAFLKAINDGIVPTKW